MGEEAKDRRRKSHQVSKIIGSYQTLNGEVRIGKNYSLEVAGRRTP